MKARKGAGTWRRLGALTREMAPPQIDDETNRQDDRKYPGDAFAEDLDLVVFGRFIWL